MANSKLKSSRLINYRFTPLVFVGVLSCLTALSALLLTSPRVSADSSGVVNLSMQVPAACSLSINQVIHSATINSGDSGTIGTSTVKSVCNDTGGLAVYVVGYTGDSYGSTNLVASAGSNNYIPSAVIQSPTNSQWNMTLAQVSGAYAPTIVTGYDAAHVIPDEYTKVAYRDSATDGGNGATGANFTATFNAYVSLSQPAGSYTGKVKFLLVHPSTHDAPVTPVAVPHQICYYGNNEDEGSMACQTTVDVDGSTTAISVGADVQLRASNFSRTGYGFTGWNTKEDGTGTQYGPMETITFTQEMYDNGLVLFANWQAAEASVTMQTFDDTVSPYSTAPNGTVIALRDIRDNDVYAVAKLDDGNWWMIENLRLDYDANITTSNTQSNGGAWGGVFAGLPEPESADFSDSTTANSLYTTNTSSTDLRIITGSNQGYRFPRYNNNNTASRATSNTTSDTNVYGYGNYYTWSAAVADTTDYTTGNQSVTNTSLCPTGWHLPKGGDKSNEANNEWWNLTVNGIMNGTKPASYDSQTHPYYFGTPEGANASKALMAYPTNLVYSGIYYTGIDYSSSVLSRGASGLYWSSTVSNSDSAYFETLSSSYVSPGTGSNGKYRGCTVRCLAD